MLIKQTYKNIRFNIRYTSDFQIKKLFCPKFLLPAKLYVKEPYSQETAFLCEAKNTFDSYVVRPKPIIHIVLIQQKSKN